MSTRSPENESNKISSSKSPEPSHSLLSDEFSETESEDSGLSSSLASGSKRDGELRSGLRALSKVETSHYKKTESCDSVTSGHVAQEYLSGKHVIVLDAEMKGDSRSSLSHGGEVVSDEFIDCVSTDVGLKRYHSCQVLDSIPSDAGELGPKLVRRSTESNLGNVDGRLRKSLSLSLSELHLVGKGLPLCWESREEDPVEEGDVGEFTTVHYKSPEIALRPSRGFGRSVSKDSAHWAKPVWKGSDGSIGRVQPRALEIVSTHESSSKEAAERIDSIPDSKDTPNQNDSILNSREVAEHSDSIPDFKEIADQNDSIIWTRLPKAEVQNVEDQRDSSTAAAENIQGSYGDVCQTNIGDAAAAAEDETMKRSSEQETTRHTIIKMNHAVEDSARSLTEVATEPATLRRPDPEQSTAFKVTAQPNPGVSLEPPGYTNTGLATKDDINPLLKKAPSKMSVVVDSHSSLGGGRTSKEVQQIVPQPSLTLRGPTDPSCPVELDRNETIFSDLDCSSTDIDMTPRTTRTDEEPLPTSEGRNESIYNLRVDEITNELKEAKEQIDSISDCKEAAEQNDFILNSKEADEKAYSVLISKEDAEQNYSISNFKETAAQNDSVLNSKEIAERNDSNTDSEETVEQNDINPDSKETVEQNDSIPDLKEAVEKSDPIIDSETTVTQTVFILNSKIAAEQNASIPDLKEAAEQTDIIPDLREAAEHNDFISDLKEAAEQNNSILESKEAIEKNDSMPDFKETTEQNDSIRDSKRDGQIPDFGETAEKVDSISDSTEAGGQSGSILDSTNAAEQTSDSISYSTESVVQNVSIPEAKEANEHANSISNSFKETEKQHDAILTLDEASKHFETITDLQEIEESNESTNEFEKTVDCNSQEMVNRERSPLNTEDSASLMVKPLLPHFVRTTSGHNSTSEELSTVQDSVWFGSSEIKTKRETPAIFEEDEKNSSHVDDFLGGFAAQSVVNLREDRQRNFQDKADEIHLEFRHLKEEQDLGTFHPDKSFFTNRRTCLEDPACYHVVEKPGEDYNWRKNTSSPSIDDVSVDSESHNRSKSQSISVLNEASSGSGLRLLNDSREDVTEAIAAAVHTRDASAQTSKSLEDIFVATLLGAKAAESQGSGQSCVGASPRDTPNSWTLKRSLQMEPDTDEDSSDAKLLIQTTLDFVRKALTPKSSDMITLSPLADETDSCDTCEEKSGEDSQMKNSQMQNFQMQNSLIQNSQMQNSQIQNSLKGDEEGSCLSDETTQTLVVAFKNDKERTYASVGTNLTEWGTELLNERDEQSTPRKTNVESHCDTQERNDVSEAAEQNTLSGDSNVYDEKATPSCSQSEEPAKVCSKEPATISSEEPAKVSSEEAVKVSSEKPARVLSEEPATVSSEEAATVSSSEEPAKVSSKEPAKVFSEEPAKVSSEKPATVSLEEPATVSLEEPATVSSEESAKVSSEEPVNISSEESVKVSLEEPATVSSEEPATVSSEEPATVSSEESAKISSEEPASVSSEESAKVFSEEPGTVSSKEPANVSSNSATGFDTSESNRRWRTSVNESTAESDKIRVFEERSEALGSDEKMIQTLDDQIEPLREEVQGYVDTDIATIDPLNAVRSQIAGTLRESHTINDSSHEFSGDSSQDFGIVKTIDIFSGNLEETVEVPHTLTRMDVPEQVKRFGDLPTATAGVTTRSEKLREDQIQLLSTKHSAYRPENVNRSSSHELKILDCFSQHANLQHSADCLEDQASSLICDDELILGSESAHSICEKVAQNIDLPETLNAPQQPQGKATTNKESFLTDSDSLSSNPETSWVKHRSNFESYSPNENSTKSHTDIERDSILAESFQDPVDSRSKILPWLTPGVTADGRFDFLGYTNSNEFFPEYEKSKNSSSDFNNTTLGSEETRPNCYSHFDLHSPQFKQQTESSQDFDDLSTSGSLHITELPAGKDYFLRGLSETTEHPERCSEQIMADWDSSDEHLRDSRVTETEPRDSHSHEYIGLHADIRFGPSKLLELEDIDRPQSVKQKPRSFEADSNNLIHRVPNVRRVEDNRSIEKNYDLVDDVISEAGDVVEDVIIERSTGDITAKGNVVNDDATLREAEYIDDVSLEGDIISKFKQTGDENFKHDATSNEFVADDVTIKPCSDEIKGFTVEIRDNDDISNGRLIDFLCYGTGQMSEDISFPEPAAAVYDDEACEHPSASWHRRPHNSDVRTAAADLEFDAGTNQDSEWPSAAGLPEGTPSSLETSLDPLLEERRHIYASLLRLQYLSEEWMSLIEDHLDSGLYSTDQQLLDLVETQPSGSPLESREEAKALHQTWHGAAGAPRLGQTTAGKPDGNAFQDEANPRRDSKEAYLGPYDNHRSYHSVSSITMPDSCEPPESYCSADAEAYASQVMPDADRSRYTMHDRYDQSPETTARDYQSVQTMRDAYQTRSLTEEGDNLPETPWERNQPQSPITDVHHLQLLSPASYHYQKMIGNTQLKARGDGKSEKYRTRFRFLTLKDPGLDPDLSFEGNSLIGTHDAAKWSLRRTSKQNVQRDAAKWTHSGTGKENVLHGGANWYRSGTGKESTTHNGGKWSSKKADTEGVTHDVAKWKTGQERLPRRNESNEEFERSIPGSLYGTTKCALCTMTTIKDIAPQLRYGFEKQTPVGPSSGSRRCSQCHRDYKTMFEDTLRDRTQGPRPRWMVLKPSYMPHRRRSDQSLNDVTGHLTAGCVKRSMIF